MSCVEPFQKYRRHVYFSFLAREIVMLSGVITTAVMILCHLCLIVGVACGEKSGVMFCEVCEVLRTVFQGQ